MPPKRYSIYASPALDRVLAERLKPDSEAEGFRSRSSMLSAIADRYAEIVRRSAPPDLTVGEWCLIFDVLNGCWLIDNPAISAMGLPHQIADACTLDGAGEKWDVDGLDLARRITAMPFAAQVAIIDTAERFWSLGVQDGEDYETVVKRLVPHHKTAPDKAPNAFELTVIRASALAYDEDADHVVGQIGGQWAIAHTEDLGRQNEMGEPRFVVHGDGLDAADVMGAFEAAGIDGDQDWDNESTTYRLDDQTRIQVCGSQVEILT